MKKRYFDYAATAPMDKRVYKAMKPFLTNRFENSNSVYENGIANAKAIKEARRVIADQLVANPENIFFTSGATESNNWAIKGFVIKKMKELGRLIKIAYSPLDHDSVINSIKFCEKYFNVKGLQVPIDKKRGCIDTVRFQFMMAEENPDMFILTWANNELGTIEELPYLVNMAKCVNCGMFIHVDATQALPHFPVVIKSLEEAGIDSVSCSAHKIGGPKGIGLLWLKDKDKNVEPLIIGGSQESGLRGGTSNTAAIVGFATALENCDYDKLRHHYEDAGKYLIKKLKELLSDYVNTSFTVDNLTDVDTTGIVNLYLPFESSGVVALLDSRGFEVSSGSACTGDGERSHVLNALDKDGSRGLRIAITPETTHKDIDRLVDGLYQCLYVYGMLRF